MTHLIGMGWVKNDGDICEEVFTDAMRHVDTLFLADGGSTDRSWEILQSLKARYPDKIEHIQQEDERNDRAQRNSLLDKIRARYRPEDTWVQVFESDVFVLDTDIRAAIRDAELAVSWHMLNACRLQGTWKGLDTYPEWSMPIRELMPYAHWMEVVIYTFRALPGLRFSNSPWRPWPQGWTRYTDKPVKTTRRSPEVPLLLHVGCRSPKYFHHKYRHCGKRHPRYPQWRTDSPENAERTVPYFNGTWNKDAFLATRDGWTQYLVSRTSTPSPIISTD